MDYQILQTIKEAGKKYIILRIIYTEQDGTSEGWRYVEPYSLRGLVNEYALFAWDVQKNGIRRFVLDRINDAELTDRTFNPRYPVEIL